MSPELIEIIALTCLAGIALLGVVVGAADVLIKGRRDWAPHLLVGFGFVLLAWTIKKLLEMWG